MTSMPSTTSSSTPAARLGAPPGRRDSPSDSGGSTAPPYESNDMPVFSQVCSMNGRAAPSLLISSPELWKTILCGGDVTLTHLTAMGPVAAIGRRERASPTPHRFERRLTPVRALDRSPLEESAGTPTARAAVIDGGIPPTTAAADPEAEVTGPPGARPRPAHRSRDERRGHRRDRPDPAPSTARASSPRPRSSAAAPSPRGRASSPRTVRSRPTDRPRRLRARSRAA